MRRCRPTGYFPSIVGADVWTCKCKWVHASSKTFRFPNFMSSAVLPRKIHGIAYSPDNGGLESRQ